MADERERLLEQATEIVADDEYDDPPMSVVIDAVLTHRIESKKNIDDARVDVDPKTIQIVANTSVIGLQYRSLVESEYR